MNLIGESSRAGQENSSSLIIFLLVYELIHLFTYFVVDACISLLVKCARSHEEMQEFDVGLDLKGFIISSGRQYICLETEHKVGNYYNGKRYVNSSL